MKKIGLPEIIAVGVFDAEFRIKKKISDKRRTEMFEIELPIEDGGISYIDECKADITTDTIICSKPGQIRHTKLPFKCYYVHIILSGGIAYDVLNSAPCQYTTKRSEEYKEIFRSICKYYETGLEYDIIKQQSLILKLIYLISEDTEFIRNNQYKTRSGDDVIEKAIEYINNNYTTIAGLEEIAESIPLSPVYFHNRFKLATGVTPHDYMLEKKINKAANLLVTTNFSLSQIAYECGFSSQSYFSFIFKKKMKLTPREYMRKVYNKYP